MVEVFVVFVISLGDGYDDFDCFFFGWNLNQQFGFFDVYVCCVVNRYLIFVIDVYDVDVFIGGFGIVVWVV